MIDLYYPAVIGWGLLAIINLIDCIKEGSVIMLVNYLAATCWILIGIMNYPIYRRGDYPSWFVFYMAIFSAFLGSLRP